MTLEQIKQEVLKVPGTYEGESGDIRDNRKYLIIGQSGNVSDIFKFSLNNLVYIQCLSEDLQKEFIQIVWDYYGYSEDFKDNVERLKYTTDMKIRLCEEFEELKISLFGNLKWNFAFLICSEGDIATNEKIGINYICAPETTKADYIDFEKKVRDHFKFDFAKEFDKLEDKYEWFEMGITNTKTTQGADNITGFEITKSGSLNDNKFDVLDILPFNKIETKEQFAVLIKYLDFCDKQYQERKQFLEELK